MEKIATGFVYFAVQRGPEPLVKIGYSEYPARRLKSLQTASPYLVELIGIVPGDKRQEKAIHRKFSRYRERGEWFRYCDEMDFFLADYGLWREYFDFGDVVENVFVLVEYGFVVFTGIDILGNEFIPSTKSFWESLMGHTMTAAHCMSAAEQFAMNLARKNGVQKTHLAVNFMFMLNSISSGGTYHWDGKRSHPITHHIGRKEWLALPEEIGIGYDCVGYGAEVDVEFAKVNNYHIPVPKFLDSVKWDNVL